MESCCCGVNIAQPRSGFDPHPTEHPYNVVRQSEARLIDRLASLPDADAAWRLLGSAVHLRLLRAPVACFALLILVHTVL